MINYVYVAGPYTARSRFHWIPFLGPWLTMRAIERNVLHAIQAGDRLLMEGYVPFVPHLFHLWDGHHHHSWDQWMHLCLRWVSQCDAVVTLGDSPGVRQEVAWAFEEGIPVFHSIEDML